MTAERSAKELLEMLSGTEGKTTHVLFEDSESVDIERLEDGDWKLTYFNRHNSPSKFTYTLNANGELLNVAWVQDMTKPPGLENFGGFFLGNGEIDVEKLSGKWVDLFKQSGRGIVMTMVERIEEVDDKRSKSG